MNLQEWSFDRHDDTDRANLHLKKRQQKQHQQRNIARPRVSIENMGKIGLNNDYLI